MKKTTEEQIVEKLDQILRILSIQVGQEQSLTERARLLKLAGLDNQVIASVINTTPATVRALTARITIGTTKKKKRTKSKKT